MTMNKIFNVGVNDMPRGSTRTGGKQLPFYKAWYNMLSRCYCPKYHEIEPSYRDCEVCDEWKTLSNFKLWFDENYIDGWQLDKDLLVYGNMMYSPTTCRFVPQSLNSLIGEKNRKSSDLPRGVTFCSGKYRAKLNHNGKYIHIGVFDTVGEAKRSYSKYKSQHITNLLPTFRNMGVCDEVLESLSTRFSVV